MKKSSSLEAKHITESRVSYPKCVVTIYNGTKAQTLNKKSLFCQIFTIFVYLHCEGISKGYNGVNIYTVQAHDKLLYKMKYYHFK